MGDGQEQPGGFCVVANVAAETAHGQGGLELRRGARHFAAGAKVWVLPPQWAMAVTSWSLPGTTGAPGAAGWPGW